MFQPALQPRTWKLWERSPNPPPFHIQARDVRVLEEVFRHRYLQPAHLALLLQGSADHLARRCRVLWQHGYLERPKALRPTKALTEQIVYGLGAKGAELLEHVKPEFRIGGLDWNETPKKQRGFPYIDHQLAIARVMVCLQAACQQRGIHLGWDGHFNRRRWRIVPPGEDQAFLPDGYFTIEVPNKGVAHHFLEVDRGSISLARMRERYGRYFTFWKEGWDQRAFKHFRVLTVTQDPDYLDSLRRVARPTGRDKEHRQTWKALMFSHLGHFELERPEGALDPIWRYADEEDTLVSLL